MTLDDELKRKIDTLPDKDIWTLFAYVSLLLKERGLVRTGNIVGERGEFLAVETYNETPGLPKLQAAPEGTQNTDALSRQGDRYSIKTISEPGVTTGVFYGLGEKDENAPEKKFEYVIIVQIGKDYGLKRMLELTWEQFLQHRKWHSRMRAWNLSVTRKLLRDARIIFEAQTMEKSRLLR
jgi:hypothetical protein